MAPAAEITEAKLLKQGAEAKLYSGKFFGRPVIIKERFKKTYRHPTLDKSLTSQRTKAEVRSMIRCRSYGIATPALYFVDLLDSRIVMEHLVGSETVRDHICAAQARTEPGTPIPLQSLAEKIGRAVAIMHSNNMVHGDLTTSNMLLRDHTAELVLIDFGLAGVNAGAEEKGVDLYVLERALLSTHPNTEHLFAAMLESYRASYKGSGVEEVIHKFEEVRLRGRKRTMVG